MSSRGMTWLVRVSGVFMSLCFAAWLATSIYASISVGVWNPFTDLAALAGCIISARLLFVKQKPPLRE